MMRKKRVFSSVRADTTRIENNSHVSKRNFFKKKLNPSQTLNKILTYSYFFLFYFKKGGRFFRNKFRLFFLGVSLKSWKFKLKSRQKKENLKFSIKFSKNIFQNTEWSIFNNKAFTKKEFKFETLESRYSWKLPTIFWEKSKSNTKVKKVYSIWSISDLRFLKREVSSSFSRIFSRIFEFEKKENVVQKNPSILNNYYKIKYRQNVIENTLLKAIFGEYFIKIFSKAAPFKSSLFKNNLLRLPRRLRFLFQQNPNKPADYKELSSKTSQFYLLKEQDLRRFLKKVDKNKLGSLGGSFFFTGGFGEFYSRSDFTAFNTELKSTNANSLFAREYKNDWPLAQNYFNQDLKKSQKTPFSSLFYFFREKNQFSDLSFFEETRSTLKKLEIVF